MKMLLIAVTLVLCAASITFARSSSVRQDKNNYFVLDDQTLRAISYYNPTDTTIVFEGKNLLLPFRTGVVITAPIGPNAPYGVSPRVVTIIQQRGDQFFVGTEIIKTLQSEEAEDKKDKDAKETKDTPESNYYVDGM